MRRDESGQRRRVHRYELLQHRLGGVLYEVAEGGDPGTVRSGKVFAARAEQHDRPVAMRRSRRLGDERRLADPRLAPYETQPLRALLNTGLLDRRRQDFQLGAASEEREQTLLQRTNELRLKRHRRKRAVVTEVRLPLHLDDRNRLGEPLELHLTEWYELVHRMPANEDPYHLAGQNLPAVSRSAQTRRLDHRVAEEIIVLFNGLTRRQPDPNRKRMQASAVVPLDPLLHRHRAGDRDEFGLVNATIRPSPRFLTTRPPAASTAPSNKPKWVDRNSSAESRSRLEASAVQPTKSVNNTVTVSVSAKPPSRLARSVRQARRTPPAPSATRHPETVRLRPQSPDRGCRYFEDSRAVLTSVCTGHHVPSG